MHIIGIPRKVVTLGRIVIPKELREIYHIDKNSTLFICSTPEGILLKTQKYKLVEKNE